MTTPGFTAEGSLYSTTQHYRSAATSNGRSSNSVLAQQLCRGLGQTCGGIDLFCCPGLRCTARLGGLGHCIPVLPHCGCFHLPGGGVVCTCF